MKVVEGGNVSRLLKDTPIPRMFHARQTFPRLVIPPEEIPAAVERELDRCRAIARQSGMVLEQMTPEQFAGNIPVKSYAELVAMTQDTCFDSLRCCLLGQHYAQNDGFAVTEGLSAECLQQRRACGAPVDPLHRSFPL